MIQTKTFLEHKDKFVDMVNSGALIVVNHSGGKDSQATYGLIKHYVPSRQLAVVHADLGDDVEWDGVQDHIKDNIKEALEIAKPIYKDGSEKTLLDMIERRGMFPSASQRYCTSDLKRSPCEKVIRRLANAMETKLIVSCMGFRAEESPARAKVETWKLEPRLQVAGRTWVTFQPIHDVKLQGVWDILRQTGQKRHRAYDEGMSRLSCRFCILANDRDLRLSARLHPELLEKYIALEDRIGHTFKHNKSIREYAA